MRTLSVLALACALFCALCARGEARFSDPEKNFKAAMEAVLKNYVDKGVGEEELYRAATAGMLDSLNKNKEGWSKLLAPEDFAMLQSDLSGKVGGVGLTLSFDSSTGHGSVISAIAKSPAEKAGFEPGDRILSVDGQSFKGKELRDLVAAIRGSGRGSVLIKALRGDRIVSASLKRETIAFDPVALDLPEPGLAFIRISYFNERAPALAEAALRKAVVSGAKRMIVDLRGNEGGGFEQSIRTLEAFAPQGSSVARTRDRVGTVKRVGSGKGILPDGVNLVVLVSRETKSGAELFAGSLKELRGATLIGEPTFGKWNAQTVETLPNGYAIKYTVEEFQTAGGHSFAREGLRPSLEVAYPKDGELLESLARRDFARRAAADPQLRAALEFVRER